VAECNGLQIVLMHGALKEMTAQISGVLLNLRHGRRGLLDRERQAEFRGESADEGFIGVGFGGAEVMVDVKDVQVAAKHAAQFMEDVEKGDGIGTAGNGYAKGLPSRG
jgi:hypothetical protein